MIINELREKLKEYRIIPITEDNLEEAFQLMHCNTYFYSRTQFHELTLEECREDMTALPPNTDMKQKYYLGIYEGDQMIAVLDYIEGYPEKEVAFIGLFILNHEIHGRGLGRHLISTFIEAARDNRFTEIKLGCYETNEIGYSFWSRMGFVKERETIREVDGRELNLIVMHMLLQ